MPTFEVGVASGALRSPISNPEPPLAIPFANDTKTNEPEGGAGARDTRLKAFVKAAEETTGVASATNSATVTKGVKRTATFTYPTTHVVGALKPGVLMELGTRGGALPIADSQSSHSSPSTPRASIYPSALPRPPR